MKETLRELIHHLNAHEEDVDVSVDGMGNSIAIVGGEIGLTELGRQKFGAVLDMELDGYTIIGTDEDYDLLDEGKGNLTLVWEFLTAMAGYCSCTDYEKWFEGNDVELI